MITHPLPPVYDQASRVLILGSFPSVKSREAQFYYGHAQNRFWPVMAAVFGQEVPGDIGQKIEFLHRNGVALWDVIASCDIAGSADSSIRSVTPNDLRPILDGADIRRIFVNGRTAEKYYNRYLYTVTGREAVCLPSTSPANASWSLPRLIGAWRQVALAARPAR